MTKEALKNKIAGILNISNSEKELAFELMLKKLFEILDFDEAISIPEVGVFSLKKEPLLREERDVKKGIAAKRNLVFLPKEEDASGASKAMYLTFDLDNSSKNYLEFDENVFSISIGKPIVSSTGIQSGNADSDNPERMIATLEEKVQNLVANTEKISDYDIWNEFASKEPKMTDEVNNEDIVLPDEDLKQLVSENVEGDIKRDAEEVESEVEEFEEEQLLPVDEEDIVDEIDNQEESFEASDAEVAEEKNNNADETNQMDKIDKTNDGQTEIDNQPKIEEDLSEKESDDNKITKDDSDEDEIDWDWGDELKEELEADDKNIGNKEEDLGAKAGDENTKDEASELFESVENVKSESEPEVSEAEIPEDNENEAETNGKEKSTQTVIYSPDDVKEPAAESKIGLLKKKFNFGKTFWILVSAFVLVGVAGIYFLFFTGSTKQNKVNGKVIPDTLIHKRLKPLENVPVKKESADIKHEGNVKGTVASSEKSDSMGKANVKAPGKKVGQKEQNLSGNSGSLYRSFPDEKQIRNLIFLQNGVYSVQISSRRSRIRAEEYVKKLRNVGYNAFIVKTYLSQLKSTWYRIRIGFFKTIKEAMNFRLKNKF